MEKGQECREKRLHRKVHIIQERKVGPKVAQIHSGWSQRARKGANPRREEVGRNRSANVEAERDHLRKSLRDSRPSWLKSNRRSRNRRSCNRRSWGNRRSRGNQNRSRRQDSHGNILSRASSSERPLLNAAASSSLFLSPELPAKGKPGGSATKIGWKTSQRCSTIKEIVEGNLEGGIVVESRTV